MMTFSAERMIVLSFMKNVLDDHFDLVIVKGSNPVL